ncbi:NADH:flavin oxidoreductase [Anaerococcus tetradius]|uniref:NADH:flavin oxidoreductase n=1 Tax=Anaerococcus tetradius TaxID=33036 RepID=UPI0023F03513|nr:NADH:flavin oxidoreductase [Anaerococcus tetradius]
MEFKNNIYLPPMARESSIDGKITDALIDYYESMAKLGFGLIILEHAYVDIKGKASPKQMAIDENYDRENLIKIKDVIHKEEAKAFMQISHCGRLTRLDGEKFGPTKEDGVSELSVDQIKDIEDKFIEAGKRVKDMGFDGLEIHCAHGYLLNQFYSPLVNKRDDEYGGSLENRHRVLLEILKKMRRALGDFPIMVRLGACDYEEGGNTIDDAIKAVKVMEEYIDFIDISGGINGFMKHSDNDIGYFTKESKAIKENTKVKVLMTGGIKNKKEAEELISEGACHMVGIGRASLNKDFTLE